MLITLIMDEKQGLEVDLKSVAETRLLKSALRDSVESRRRKTSPLRSLRFDNVNDTETKINKEKENPELTRFMVSPVNNNNNTESAEDNEEQAEILQKKTESEGETDKEQHINLADTAHDEKSPGESRPPNVSAAEVIRFFIDKVNRNSRQIRLNCFLFFLVGLIVTAIVVFVIVEPEEQDHYEMSLSTFATFWPLQRRLSVQHPFHTDYDSLELVWGYHVPPTGNTVPSYCSKRGGLDCMNGNCCLRYPGHSRLHLSSFQYESANCVKLEWSKEVKVEDENIFYFSDCIFTRGRNWYGGFLEPNVSWPLTWQNVSDFKLVLTGQEDGTGVVEPFWVSSEGYSVSIESSGPLLWNFTQDYFCMKSLNAFQYTVCEAASLRDLYRSGRRNDPKPDDGNSSHKFRLKNSLGSIFLSKNVSEIVNSRPSKMTKLIETLQDASWELLLEKNSVSGGRFVLAFENTEVFAINRSQKCLEFINLLKNSNGSVYKFETAVEINNFVGLNEVEKNEKFWKKFIWQHDGFPRTSRSTGLIVWRERLWEILDLTDPAVARWYLASVRNWGPYRVADHVTVAGGAASLLPVAADLNVSAENGNFYTKHYANLVASLGSSVLIPVGFKSQSEPLYTSVSADCANTKSVIPLALSLSILGYVHLALDIKINETTSDLCDFKSLEYLFQLAMFFPVARMPLEPLLYLSAANYSFYSSHALEILQNAIETFGKVRKNVTLPHFSKAIDQYFIDRSPPIRPMWWTREGDLGEKNRDQTLSINTQFMIGSDMVVVTFLGHPDVENRVYLPKGNWSDPLWHGGRVSVPSGQYIIYASKSPLACFVRV